MIFVQYYGVFRGLEYREQVRKIRCADRYTNPVPRLEDVIGRPQFNHIFINLVFLYGGRIFVGMIVERIKCFVFIIQQIGVVRVIGPVFGAQPAGCNIFRPAGRENII